jgi:catechol 2,3-dioxygenase-like lactoylglutathione lyase family enzyme
MKRFHVNLSVENLAESIRFYTALFARADGAERRLCEVDAG